MMRKNKEWANKFRCHGHKFTIPREAIIETLSSTDEHLSIEDIYMDVHKKYQGIGLTTVYRTLDILVNMGLVYKFDFGDGRSRFELIEEASKKEHHHHLICKSCGTIINYTDYVDDEIEFLKKAEKGLSKKYNFKIMGHLIQFYGLCKDCIC